MKRNKFILVLVCSIVSVTLANCKREKGVDCPNVATYQSLFPLSKEWFPYTSNRILIFENSALVKDTLELKNYFLGDDNVFNGDECPQTRAEFLRGNIIDKKSGDTIKVSVSQGEQILIEKSRGYILYYDTRKLLIPASPFKRFENSLTINSKTYTSVLVFECSADDKCNTAGITKFYFARTKGLVAYERNSVIWTLR
jgi:hypothetical protein